METNAERSAETVVVVVLVSVSTPFLLPHDIRKHTHPAIDEIVRAKSSGKPRFVIVLTARIGVIGIDILLIAPRHVRRQVEAIAEREIGDAAAKGLALDSLSDITFRGLIVA